MITLDFAIIGAEKACTTLLVHLLRRSELIDLPEREIRHFRDPFFPHAEALETFFEPDSRLKGIKHPAYLGRPEVPARLRRHSPAIKVIALLRDPVDRAISSYLHYVRHGQVPLKHPNEGLRDVVSAPDLSTKYRDVLEFGNYATSLARYLDFFRPQQMFVAAQETFLQSPEVIHGIFSFLEVPAPEELWPFPRVNEGTSDWGACRTAFERARRRFIYDEYENIIGERNIDAADSSSYPEEPVTIDPAVRALLREYYRRDQDRLSTLGIVKER